MSMKVVNYSYSYSLHMSSSKLLENPSKKLEKLAIYTGAMQTNQSCADVSRWMRKGWLATMTSILDHTMVTQVLSIIKCIHTGSLVSFKELTTPCLQIMKE